jgi:hypothetical protein
MDRREPPRIVAHDPSPDESHRLRPFARIANHPTARRLATPRIIGAGAVGAMVLLLVLVGGGRALRGLVAWQWSQPRHQLPFAKIDLDPPPPPWILSGTAGLLDHVRAGAGHSPSVEVLSEDLTQLRNAFAVHSPWVRRVVQVERRYPNRLVVSLVYRRPVAKLGTEKSRSLFLDDEGIALPASDIDEAAAGPLIRIKLDDPLQLADIRAGQAVTLDQGPRRAPLAEPIRAAARLASFFRDRLSSEGKSEPRLRVDAIIVADRSLSLACVENPAAMILWEPLTRGSDNSTLGDAEKWKRLVAWAESHDLTKITDQQWIEITRSGVAVRRR